MNILLCSVGRRAEFIKIIKNKYKSKIKIIGTDCNETAPALFMTDKYYLTPKISDDNYIDALLDICRKEHVDVITTLIDPEIEILSKNKQMFAALNILVLAPTINDALICFDKYKFFQLMKNNKINTINTYIDFEVFMKDLDQNKIVFPVFVKPRFGSASVGARKVNSLNELEYIMKFEDNIIIQEYMNAEDIDVDAYVDSVSGSLVGMFSKKKLESKIGGANKTISFFDDKLYTFVENILSFFDFSGPIDIDFFKKNGEYFISEINPRFGGAYIHAFRCGVDFFELIENNVMKKANRLQRSTYRENIIMVMYDSILLIENGNII